METPATIARPAEPGGPAAAERCFVDHLAALHRDPYPTYRWFRAVDPVHRHAPGAPGAPANWYLFRHRDAVEALADPRLVKRVESSGAGGSGAAAAPGGAYSELVSRWILLMDPPEHERLRAIVCRAFTPRSAQGLRPRVEAITAHLLERARRSGGMDLIADFAFPLPVAVIAELLGLGLADQALFRRWSVTLCSAIDHGRTTEALERADREVAEIRSYFGEVLAERRRRPGDDVLSALATTPELDDDDVVSTSMMLLFAGHETTSNLIGNGALALLGDPAQAVLLRDEPALLAPAVEELLRYDSPVQLTTRIAREDLELAGRGLARGDRLHVLLGSANRDPDAFPDPERLDLRRKASGHLAFGAGIHGCLGAGLGRLEGQIALRALVRSSPLPRIVGGRPQWRRSILFRGLVSLPVELS